MACSSSKKKLGEGLGEVGLTDAGGAEEQERADGLARIAETDAAASHGLGDGRPPLRLWPMTRALRRSSILRSFSASPSSILLTGMPVQSLTVVATSPSSTVPTSALHAGARVPPAPPPPADAFRSRGWPRARARRAWRSPCRPSRFFICVFWACSELLADAIVTAATTPRRDSSFSRISARPAAAARPPRLSSRALIGPGCRCLSRLVVAGRRSAPPPTRAGAWRMIHLGGHTVHFDAFASGGLVDEVHRRCRASERSGT